MSEFSVEFDFIYQWLFAIFLLVGPLFWKSLNSVFFLVLVLDDQIDRGEVSFSYLFDGFEQLVEPSLVESGLEDVSPLNKLLLVAQQEFQLTAKSLELESERFEGLLFLFGGVFEEEFADEVEIECHFVG